VRRRFEFESGTELRNIITRIRKDFHTRQSSEVPNVDMASPRQTNPVIEGFILSLALDIFEMQPSTWFVDNYDCVLLCNDRTSGWVIARPTTTLGLTGENAAHLLLDSSWDEMAVPSLITSDQGPQWSQLWRTMCSRLGVRQAFSQARRPQQTGERKPQAKR